MPQDALLLFSAILGFCVGVTCDMRNLRRRLYASLLDLNASYDAVSATWQDHFADLLERYGSPVLVLDLVKQTERREREVIVAREYRRAVEHVNSTMPPVGPASR